MKGQLFIEYLVSFSAFIVLVGYVYSSYSGNIPLFIGEAKKEDLRAKGFQISEVLINDVGEPEDWDASNVKRLGLSKGKTNLISWDKVTKFKDICENDYSEVQRLLSLDQTFSVYLFEIDEDGDRVWGSGFECTPPKAPKTAINATVKRITAFDDGGTFGLAELVVQMW